MPKNTVILFCGNLFSRIAKKKTQKSQKLEPAKVLCHMSEAARVCDAQLAWSVRLASLVCYRYGLGLGLPFRHQDNADACCQAPIVIKQSSEGFLDLPSLVFTQCFTANLPLRFALSTF